VPPPHASDKLRADDIPNLAYISLEAIEDRMMAIEDRMMAIEATLERIKAVVGPRGWIEDPGELEPYLVEARASGVA
jgi:hypothetical protein